MRTQAMFIMPGGISGDVLRDPIAIMLEPVEVVFLLCPKPGVSSIGMPGFFLVEKNKRKEVHNDRDNFQKRRIS